MTTHKFTVDFHFRALNAYKQIDEVFKRISNGRDSNRYRDIDLWNIHRDAGITEDQLFDWCKATARPTVDDLIEKLDIA